MKRNSFILALVIALVVFAASPLLSAKKDALKPTSTVSSSTETKQPSSKTAKAKSTDASRRARTNPTQSSTLTEKRGVKSTNPEIGETQAPTNQTESSPAAAINLDWVSINHGGATEVSSGNLKMGLSIAQTVAGEVSAGDLKLGLGFWYGGAAGAPTCVCPYQGDFDADGFPTSSDVGWIIDIAYGGAPDLPNPGCPTSRADFDYDGFVTISDVAWMIDYVYAGGPGPCDPCNPIQGPCAP